MVDIDIRPMAEADLDACARLAAGEDDRPASAHRDRLASYLGRPDHIHSLVATMVEAEHGSSGEVVGAARVSSDEVAGGSSGEVVGAARVSWFEPAADAPANAAPAGWYLIGLVVDPRRRREGIGLALSAARVRWALERAPVAWYFTGTRNHASFALHARLGFTEVTRDFWFPRVPFDLGGILCHVTAATFRDPDR